MRNNELSVLTVFNQKHLGVLLLALLAFLYLLESSDAVWGQRSFNLHDDIQKRIGPSSALSLTNDPSQKQVITVNPGDNLQQLVNRAPSGTTFKLSAGVHHVQVQPKDGNTFIGTEGTILSGAEELRGFKQYNGKWLREDWHKSGTFYGECAKQVGTACQYSQDLFFDNVPLAYVTSIAELKSGTWHYDSVQGHIYLADDPTGSKVEISVAPFAVSGSARGVTIQNLVIEKYANRAQFGVIHNYSTASQVGRGWVIEGNEILLNHGIGVRVDEGALLRRNHIHHNGQLGVAGSGKDIVIVENEIAHNNTRGFNFYWEAGGTKFVRTEGLIVRQNHVHHNIGPGLWTDGNNIGALYQDNIVEDNHGPGIFHEISYDAIIVGNVIQRNGFSFSWYMGAGILIAASPDVEVKRNHVIDNANGIMGVQQDRGAGSRGVYQVKNLYVHDNHVAMAAGASGLAFDPKYTGTQTANGSRFESNFYELGSQRQPFVWLGKALTKDEWIKRGQDRRGRFAPHP